MIRSALVLLSCLSLLSCATGQPTSHTASSKNAARKNVVVHIMNMHVHPATAHLSPGGNVVWVNYASSLAGVISFPESFKSALTCGEVRPIFSQAADRFESIPVTADSENVTLPCPLKPGTYDYQIKLFESLGNMNNPQLVLDGTIVAE